MEKSIDLNNFEQIFHHILKSNNTEFMSKLICMIDDSGSMNIFWKYFTKYFNNLVNSVGSENVKTFTFSDEIIHRPTGKLEEWSNGTKENIFEAAQRLLFEVENEKETDMITIIFVSDGIDDEVTVADINNLNTPDKSKRIQFFCVAVGEKFPENLSAALLRKFDTEGGTMPKFLQILKNEDCEPVFETIEANLKMKSQLKASAEFIMHPNQKIATTALNSTTTLMSTVEKIKFDECLPKNSAQKPLQIVSTGKKTTQLNTREKALILTNWYNPLIQRAAAVDESVNDEKIKEDAAEVLKHAEQLLGEVGQRTASAELLEHNSRDTEPLEKMVTYIKELSTEEKKFASIKFQERMDRLTIGNKVIENAQIMSQVSYKKSKDILNESVVESKLTNSNIDEKSVRGTVSKIDLTFDYKDINSFIKNVPFFGFGVRNEENSDNIEKITDTLIESIEFMNKGYLVTIDENMIDSVLILLHEAEINSVEKIVQTDVFKIVAGYLFCHKRLQTTTHTYLEVLIKSFIYAENESDTKLKERIILTTLTVYKNDLKVSREFNYIKSDIRKGAIEEDNEAGYKCESMRKYIFYLNLLEKGRQISENDFKFGLKCALFEHIGRNIQKHSNKLFGFGKGKVNTLADFLNGKLEKEEEAEWKIDFFDEIAKEVQFCIVEEISLFMIYKVMQRADSELKKNNIVKVFKFGVLHSMMGNMNLSFFSKLFKSRKMPLTEELLYEAVNHGLASITSKARYDEPIERRAERVLYDKFNLMLKETIRKQFEAWTGEDQSALKSVLEEKSNNVKAAMEDKLKAMKEKLIGSNVMENLFQGKQANTHEQSFILIAGPRSTKSTLIQAIMEHCGSFNPDKVAEYRNICKEVLGDTADNLLVNQNVENLQTARTIHPEFHTVNYRGNTMVLAECPNSDNVRESIKLTFFASSIVFCFNPDYKEYKDYEDKFTTILESMDLSGKNTVSIVFGRTEVYVNPGAEIEKIQKDLSSVISVFDLQLKSYFYSEIVGENINHFLNPHYTVCVTENLDADAQIEVIDWNAKTKEGLCRIVYGTLNKETELSRQDNSVLKAQRIINNLVEVEEAQSGETVIISFSPETALTNGETLKANGYTLETVNSLVFEGFVIPDRIQVEKTLGAAIDSTIFEVTIKSMSEKENDNPNSDPNNDEKIFRLELDCSKGFQWDKQSEMIMLFNNSNEFVGDGTIV